MNYRVFILSKNDLKLLIFGAVIGGIFQIICCKYLNDHPELLNNQNPVNETQNPVSKTKNRGFRTFFLREGVFGAKVVINLVGVITFVAKKGALTGLILATSGVVIKKIPKSAVSTVLLDASPTPHSDWGKLDKAKFFIVDGKQIYIDQCDQNLQYLFKVLRNPKIPYLEKKELVHSILMKHLDLKTPNGRLRFILCIIAILHVFAISDISNYFVLMQNLIKAVREGRISKRLARIIIRRLRRYGFVVDPELIAVAS